MGIDRIEFIAWMEYIMDRFDLLREQIDKAEEHKNSLDGEELLDNQDLMLTFKISTRPLQRYRSNDKLPYYIISGRIYYRLSDVHRLIRERFSVPITALKAKNGNTMPKRGSLSQTSYKGNDFTPKLKKVLK